jgi:hypothetical protein
MDKHGALATLSRTYLVYCDCTRKGSTEKMTIAAAFTGGDSDHLMIGRNGVFYDRKGLDWDATIVKIIEHPIGIRQAFWAPYKRIARMIAEQVEKMAATRAKDVDEKAAAGIAEAGRTLEAAKPAPAPQPFDVAKFAGIFAAIGLALGAIGTAVASVVTGFFRLTWWQMPLAVAGLILAVSGPSVVLAWLKLRQRTLAPILDANGWAVNTRAKINIAFGGALTAVAKLPEGAEKSLVDPFAEKRRRWPLYIVLLGVLVAMALTARLALPRASRCSKKGASDARRLPHRPLPHPPSTHRRRAGWARRAVPRRLREHRPIIDQAGSGQLPRGADRILEEPGIAQHRPDPLRRSAVLPGCGLDRKLLLLGSGRQPRGDLRA